MPSRSRRVLRRYRPVGRPFVPEPETQLLDQAEIQLKAVDATRRSQPERQRELFTRSNMAWQRESNRLAREIAAITGAEPRAGSHRVAARRIRKPRDVTGITNGGLQP